MSSSDMPSTTEDNVKDQDQEERVGGQAAIDIGSADMVLKKSRELEEK